MNASELFDRLTQQGVQLQANNGKLNIRAPKGVMTPTMREALVTHKSDLLSLLKTVDLQTDTVDLQTNSKPSVCLEHDLEMGLSIDSIGRLISGLGDYATASYTPPVISSQQMAKRLMVTFRPLPVKAPSKVVLDFRAALQRQLECAGVTIQPWQEATREFYYRIKLPGIGHKIKIKTRLVKVGVNAVIDVERPTTKVQVIKQLLAETIYRIYCRFFLKGQKLSVLRIAQMVGWAEDCAAKFVEDPTNTQVIILTDLNREFTDPDLPYPRKINIGLQTLIRTFSELVIGVSESQLSILNMNLSDSVFSRQGLAGFVSKSLIPKIFVPILPLSLDRFEVSYYDPQPSVYAQSLVTLGRGLARSGLFPPGFKLHSVIKRQSYRDIVDTIVNGRTGVSYGFVAHIEPPQYVGAVELSPAEWDKLVPVEGFSDSEIRQNSQGRRFAKIKIETNYRYRQIPDIWLVSSRSGANKTDLSLTQDVLRIGLNTRLALQMPTTTTQDTVDLKPSYDVFVMVAIALSAALYTPVLVQNGAPIVHFHGYPAAHWFKPGELWSGLQNPSVPCGTYESGIFNFLSINRLSHLSDVDIKLAALIEPDHGTNIIASDVDYLLERLRSGVRQGQIELGGKHFASLKNNSTLKNNSVELNADEWASQD